MKIRIVMNADEIDFGYLIEHRFSIVNNLFEVIWKIKNDVSILFVLILANEYSGECGLS